MAFWTGGRLQKVKAPCSRCHTTLYWDTAVYFQRGSTALFCQNCYRKTRQKGDELISKPSRGWTGSKQAITTPAHRHPSVLRDWASRGG